MKKIISLFFLYVLNVPAQYIITSPYLDHPENSVGYVDSCAQFWEKAYEPTYGGYYTNIDRMGNVINGWGTTKNSLNQSRDAYGFLRAFMLTGKDQYLVDARRALDFLYKSAWDTTYGGWYKEVDKFGNRTKPFDNKTAFYQHYALLGITASYETTRDTTDWSWMMKSYAYNENKFWDNSSQYFGYYDYITYDGTAPSGKTFNSTVDAITTHVLHLYLMTGDSVYKARLLQLADNMLNRLTKSADQQVIGFAESYDTQWNPKNGTTDEEKRTIMGHVLKTAWCFGRIYQLFPDTAYLSAAEKLVKMVWEKGYDHQYGGPYKDYIRQTGVMMMYSQDTAKAWWQMEQAITAGLMLYQITGKEMYLQMADETLDFFMKYFVDHVYGDVYADLFKNGSNILAWGGGYFKGNDGKAAYHSIETGYYVYLYSKFFVKHEPATLFYNFAADTKTRDFRMSPISFPAAKLKIKEVTLNNSPYANVDYANRILTILPGVSGKFAVTYEAANPTSVASRNAIAVPPKFELAQNYPNPFNPSTTIQFSIPQTSSVTLKVYDTIGREVKVLVNEFQNAGIHQITLNASSLSSGIYFYRLQAGSYSEIKRMALLK